MLTLALIPVDTDARRPYLVHHPHDWVCASESAGDNRRLCCRAAVVEKSTDKIEYSAARVVLIEP